MPHYDYKCEKCQDIFEVEQRITEEPLKVCPKCKGPVKRMISASGIVFKGSGFHVTDYKDNSKTKELYSKLNKPADKPSKSEKPCENSGSSSACSTCPAKKD
jgi:putative FmdB family regulatory protein